MSLLRPALKALQQGFHIFPCEPGEKQGAITRAPYRIRWGEFATNDVREVLRWYKQQPMYNPAIACKPSGLLIVDCDMPKDGGECRGTPFEYLHDQQGEFVDGTEVLRALCGQLGEDYGALLNTYSVQTTRGGLHLYFRWPKELRASQASIVKGVLDVRCNGGQYGGYVLAAGAVTPAGPYVVERDLPVADTPPWLVELCREKPRAVAVKPPPPQGYMGFSQPARAGTGNYSGLVDSVRYAIDGNLNNALFWSARAMCSDGVTIEECEDLLAPVYVECGGRGGHHQAVATIRSAYRNQQWKEGIE